MDPNKTAALAPPPGSTSSFIDPPTVSVTTITVAVLMLAFATYFVSIRFFIKAVVVKEFKIEDYSSLVAWIGLATYTAVFARVESEGLARHQWDVNNAMMEHLAFYANILSCLSDPMILTAKSAMLIQIKKIFCARRADLVYIVIVTTIAVNVVFYTGLFFSHVFACWPREAIWNSNVTGTCINIQHANIAGICVGIVNIISDLEAIVVPAWAIWRLKMTIKRKLSIYSIFGVGFTACLAAIAELYLRFQVIVQLDLTYVNSFLGMVLIVETSLVIVISCLPTMPRLYHYVRGSSDGRIVTNFEPPGAPTPHLPPKRSKGQFHRADALPDVEMTPSGRDHRDEEISTQYSIDRNRQRSENT